MNNKTVKPIEVLPTGGALGAEVRGIDISRELSSKTIKKLLDIWATHLVLLFRDQELGDADLIQFSHYFGGPHPSGARMQRWAFGARETGKGASTDARVNYVSNLDKEGNPVKRNLGTGSYELRWHSDNTYMEIPPSGTMLWADIIPEDDSGQTMFSNQVRAYEELSNDLNVLIEGKYLIHDSSRNTANLLYPHRKKPRSRNDIDGPAHPIVRIHPPTGKRALFLGRRWDYPSTYIVEMPTDEGEDILDRLWAHATQEKYVWTHHWKRGDLLLWDNRAVMHRRTTINPQQPRVLHRVMVKGEPVIPAWAGVYAAGMGCL